MTGSDDRIWIQVTDPIITASVRRAAIALAAEIGIPERRHGDIAIVAMEMATNLARHADAGAVLLRVRRTTDFAGIQLVAVDRGPGMADLADISRDGRSTGGTLGIGIGAITRLSDELDIYTQSGRGTTMAATVWGGPLTGPAAVDGITRPITGEEVCGDGWTARDVGGRTQVLLCDGLGHGPLAARATQAAIAAFDHRPTGEPRELLEHIHRTIAHTRGVVAAIAELDPDRQTVRFAGIGNIAATVHHNGARQAMVSLPGIIGAQRRDIRQFDHPLPDGALVILHSDGLTERWTLTDYPGLTSHSPTVIAATLLRDAGTRHDDASMVVATAR